MFFYLLVPTAGHTEEGNTAEPLSSKTEIQEAERPKQKDNLVDLLSYTSDLSKRLIEFENQIDESSTLSRFQNELSEISYEVQLLSRQVSTVSDNVEKNYNQFEVVKTKAYKLGYQIKKVNTPLFKIIDDLSQANTEWEQNKEELDRWSKIAENEISFQLVKADIITLQKKLALALELISEKMKPALAARKNSFELEMKIHSLTLDIEKLTQLFHKKGVTKTGSIFSSDFYSQMNKNLLGIIWKNAVITVESQRELLATHINEMLVLCLAILILSMAIHFSKKWVKASTTWYSFSEQPLAEGQGFSVRLK